MRLLILPVLLFASALLAACTASSPTPATATVPSTARIAVTPSPTPWPSSTPVPTPMPGGLYVNPGMSLGAVSRFALGTNHGPWAFVTVENQEAYKQSGVTLIRFPGGNWGDENNLDAMQIDPFITMARQINAEPLICVRLPGGTPEQAAALVSYTIKQGYAVRYWSIGNEPNLYAPSRPEWTTEYYNVQWRKFAEAMRAVDPAIQFVGPDISQFMGTPDVDPKDAQGRDWLREFLQANGDMVSVVAVHRYPFPVEKGQVYSADQLLADTPRWDTLAANLRAIVRETSGPDKPIGITEFNSSWAGTFGGESGMDTLNNAIWLADVLGRLIRQRVDMLAQFTLQSSSNIGAYGLLDHYDPRLTYYVYQLYKQFGNALVYSSSDDPLVSIYAARREDGTLTLVVVNRGSSTANKALRIEGLTSASAQVWRLDDKHKASQLESVQLGAGSTVEIPGRSATLYLVGK